METSPSLQNLLISIPSQASTFAATAMGHLIEDQVYDTAQMKKNLKRIGSVVSEWGLGHHPSKELSAAGDMGYPFKEKIVHQIPLLMLPVKVRHRIWTLLQNKDVLVLRAVSTQMQNEMDHEYGLPIIMNTTDDSVQLMHHAATRSCFVTRLDNLLYFNFFQEPDKMKYLRFHQDVPLTAEHLDYILRKFPNLHTISFSNKNLLQENQVGKLQLVGPTNTKLLLDMLSKKDSIFGVELKYNSPSSAIEWKLELQKSGTTHANVGHINLEMPGEAIHHHRDALTFLNVQRHLFSLRCQLVGLNWSCYTAAIRENSKSLIGLHLLSLKCCTDEPFDCGCLSECHNLKFLSISGENSFANVNIGGFAFIRIVEVMTLNALKNLVTLSLEKVHLSEHEFTTLQDNPNKVWIRVSQSMIEKTEVAELKLGLKVYSGYNDESYDSQDDAEYDDYFDDEQYDSIEDNSIMKTFLCDIQPALIKGLIITAWLTFC